MINFTKWSYGTVDLTLQNCVLCVCVGGGGGDRDRDSLEDSIYVLCSMRDWLKLNVLLFPVFFTGVWHVLKVTDRQMAYTAMNWMNVWDVVICIYKLYIRSNHYPCTVHLFCRWYWMHGVANILSRNIKYFIDIICKYLFYSLKEEHYLNRT